MPAHVDELTGYRYYTADQIPTAQVIHRLRDLDVPLATVHRILDATDPGARAELVTEHLHRLESELDRTRAAVGRCVDCSRRSPRRWRSRCDPCPRPPSPPSRATSS